MTYDANGGGAAPTDSNVYAINSQAIVKNKPTAPTGKAFLGWRSSVDQQLYYPGSVMNIPSNITLTAQWGDVELPATLIYKPNGGTGADVSYTLMNNERHTIIASPYTREGYQFIGWNTIPMGIGLWYARASVLVDGQDNILPCTVGTIDYRHCYQGGTAPPGVLHRMSGYAVPQKRR